MDLVQKRYGWKDSYIYHDPLVDKDFLPYSRWVEILAVIEEDLVESNYHQLELSAFQGWQNFRTQVGKGCKIRTFEDYKKSLGLRHPLEAGGSKKDEIKESEDVMEALGLTDVIERIQSKRNS